MSTQFIILYSILTLLTALGFISLLKTFVQYIRKEQLSIEHLLGVAFLFFVLFLAWVISTGIALVNYAFSILPF